jgi:uncharacterized spore protein YtfJ
MQETREKSVSTNPFEQVFRSIVDHAGAKMVFGEPVSVGGKTIVPVAKIRYGFGGGSGAKGNGDQHGGGGGGGLVAKPVGVIEISQSETRFIPITSNWMLIAAVALGAVLGFPVVPLARQRLVHNIEISGVVAQGNRIDTFQKLLHNGTGKV